MFTIDQITACHDAMTAERWGLHAYPETVFEDREIFLLHSTRYEFNDDVLPMGAS